MQNYTIHNTAGRLLGKVEAENEEEAKTTFFLRYCEEHNIDPHDEKQSAALRGLVNPDRIVIAPEVA